MIRLSIFVLLGFGVHVNAWGYPQMVRHGYARCTSCHVSPSGGGVLTDYGRALSREVLSTWTREGEELDGTAPLLYGADFRAVQVHSRDRQRTAGRYIEMQKEVELGWQQKTWTVTVRGAADMMKESEPWYIPGYYALVQPRPDLMIRVGRFSPRFGIQTPEHILSTRALMNLGLQADRDTVEFVYEKDTWDFSVSRSIGEFENKSSANAWFAQGNYLLTSKMRLGLSVEKKLEESERHSFGGHALLGLSENVYVLSEVLYQETDVENSSKRESVAHFAKLGWEIQKGLHLILLEDFKKRDLAKEQSSEDLYGLGFEFFPAPHLELQGIWAQRRSLARDRAYGDYAWLMLHIYL